MFGILFAVTAILLVGALYFGVKSFLTARTVNERLEFQQDLFEVLSDDYESLMADRNALAGKLNVANKQVSDMETALNISLQENMPSQVEIKPFQEFHKIRSLPLIGTGAHQLVEEFHRAASMSLPVVGIQSAKLVNLSTGEMMDISSAATEIALFDDHLDDLDGSAIFDFTKTHSMSFEIPPENAERLKNLLDEIAPPKPLKGIDFDGETQLDLPAIEGKIPGVTPRED